MKLIQTFKVFSDIDGAEITQFFNPTTLTRQQTNLSRHFFPPLNIAVSTLGFLSLLVYKLSCTLLENFD